MFRGRKRVAELPCVVCGTANRTRWWMAGMTGADLALACCRHCGHVYQCPRIDKNHGDTFFSEAYGDSKPENRYFDPAAKLVHARELLKLVQVYCPDAHRILEIGAGIGAFVRAASDAGYEVVGTEVIETAARRARELFGIELVLGPLEALPQQATLFDVVVLWDVIEHCPQPDDMLASIHGRLREGGKVLLTTGNYENAARFASPRHWWCWQADHYHYFSPGGLSRLGTQQGFNRFVMDRVPRIRAQGESRAPSPLRFLNPLHVARSLKIHALMRIARWRWPHHWDIGIMLCCMTKEGGEATGRAAGIPAAQEVSSGCGDAPSSPGLRGSGSYGEKDLPER